MENLSESILIAAREIHELRKSIREVVNNNAVIHRIADMEKRLIEAIAKNPAITPSLEAAAMTVQSALDRLDATIPDKTES